MIRLQIQDQLQARVDAGLKLDWYSPRPFGQVVIIECYDLRDVRDGVLGEPAGFCGEKDVSGSVEESCVRREDDSENGTQPAAVKRLGLNYNNGASKSGLRSTGFFEIGPPDFTALHYHSDELTVRA